MDLSTFLSKIGRRACLDPYSKHYNQKKGQIFNKIIKDETEEETINAEDGVVLMSFLEIGELKKKIIIFFAQKGVKIANMDKILEEKKKHIPPTDVTETGG